MQRRGGASLRQIFAIVSTMAALVFLATRSSAAAERPNLLPIPDKLEIAVPDLVKHVDPLRRAADPDVQIQAKIDAQATEAQHADEKTDADGSTRYVIIHADDAGMSHSANRGTIDGMQNGIVSSASIMVPCPWFVEFAKYAREHPQGDYGIHLTLNSEWSDYRWGPVLPASQVPSLVDKDGYLWDGTQDVALNAKAEHVAAELRAQIDRAKQFGIPLSHLDTHMGALLVRPDLIEVYVRLGLEYDLPVLFLREFDVPAAKLFPALAAKASEMLPLLDGQNLPILDRVVQFYDNRPHGERRAAYLEAFRDLPPGVTEIIIHCGYDDDELRAITGSAAMRDSDRRMFTDPQLRDEIERLGVKIIDWREFRAMIPAREQ